MIRDISNQRFGRVVAIAPTGEKKWGVTLWRYRCDCGTEKVAAVNSLKSGLVRSCGCLVKERAKQVHTRHGLYGSPTYKTWNSMIQRCTNPAIRGFRNYGGRGISVCDRWRSFENFYEDMGDRPPAHSLDRIDVNGNYTPENCRWATAREQSRNKRNTVLSDEVADRIRALYLLGMGPRKIAKEVGRSHYTVCGVIYLGHWT